MSSEPTASPLLGRLRAHAHDLLQPGGTNAGALRDDLLLAADALEALLCNAVTALLREGRPQAATGVSEIEKLAETFAMEYLTGHYRQLREDERRSFDQLKVVMLAFFAASKRHMLAPPADAGGQERP